MRFSGTASRSIFEAYPWIHLEKIIASDNPNLLTGGQRCPS